MIIFYFMIFFLRELSRADDPDTPILSQTAGIVGNVKHF